MCRGNHENRFRGNCNVHQQQMDCCCHSHQSSSNCEHGFYSKQKRIEYYKKKLEIMQEKAVDLELYIKELEA